MERFLVKQTASAAVVQQTVAVSSEDRKQRTLLGLKKVVRMGKTSVIVFSDTDLAEACSVLSDDDSTDDDKLKSLRRLSCWQISKANLISSPQIGRQVRLLKRHENKDVAALARRLIDKWKAIILAASQPSSSQAGPSQSMLTSS